MIEFTKAFACYKATFCIPSPYRCCCCDGATTIRGSMSVVSLVPSPGRRVLLLSSKFAFGVKTWRRLAPTRRRAFGRSSFTALARSIVDVSETYTLVGRPTAVTASFHLRMSSWNQTDDMPSRSSCMPLGRESPRMRRNTNEMNVSVGHALRFVSKFCGKCRTTTKLTFIRARAT
jgi:hypothetical protein